MYSQQPSTVTGRRVPFEAWWGARHEFVGVVFLGNVFPGDCNLVVQPDHHILEFALGEMDIEVAVDLVVVFLNVEYSDEVEGWGSDVRPTLDCQIRDDDIGVDDALS